MHRSQNLSEKKVPLDQFLTSFISFYFEILSYLACGEKIIKLASSVKLGEKSTGNLVSLTCLIQKTLFLLKCHICYNLPMLNSVN